MKEAIIEIQKSEHSQTIQKTLKLQNNNLSSLGELIRGEKPGLTLWLTGDETTAHDLVLSVTGLLKPDRLDIRL